MLYWWRQGAFQLNVALCPILQEILVISRLFFLDLTQSRQWLSSFQRKALSEIINVSFANIDAVEYLAKYFDSPVPYQRKLRLYLHNEQIVGYCLLTFTDMSDCTVIKASAAFLPQYRKGGNTFLFSIQEGFKSWLKRPWRKHYYADTMLSPAMYRAIAKNTAIIWPHFVHQAPKELFDRFNPDGQSSNENPLRCLVLVDRTSNYSQQELKMLRSSDKPEIQYYCQINPHFDKGVALFVIVPVNLRQFVQSLIKILRKV